MSASFNPGDIVEVLTDSPSNADLRIGDRVRVIRAVPVFDTVLVSEALEVTGRRLPPFGSWAVRTDAVHLLPGATAPDTTDLKIGDRVRVAADATTALGDPVYFDRETEGVLVALADHDGDVTVRATDARGYTISQYVGLAFVTRLGSGLDAYPVGSRVKVLTDGIGDVATERSDHSLPIALYLKGFEPGEPAEVVDHSQDVSGFGPLLEVRFTSPKHDGSEVVRYVRTVQVAPLVEEAPEEAEPTPAPVVHGFERGDVVVLAPDARSVDGEPALIDGDSIIEGSAMFLSGPDDDGDLVLAVSVRDEDGDVVDEIVWVRPEFVTAASKVEPWPPVIGQTVSVVYGEVLGTEGASTWDGPAVVSDVSDSGANVYVTVKPTTGAWAGVRGTFRLEYLRPLDAE